ncbi:MAG: sulfatase-like hydrolase/transferase [Pirellulales bacterium]
MKAFAFVRTSAWVWSLALALAPAARAESPSAGKVERKPNIVLIISDDLGYNDLGFQGSPDVRTPHLDALARRGTRFTNAYVTGPICGPTRAGLISGRYQQKHSYDGNPRPDQGLNLEEATLADVLKAGGYATCAIGKWHLGQKPEYLPPARGFDEFFGFYGAMHSYLPGSVADDAKMVFEGTRRGRPEDNANQPRRPGALERLGANGNNPPAGAAPGRIIRGDAEVEEPEYLTKAFAREAVDFIERRKDQPFFLYLAFNASHSPLQPPAEYLARFPNLEGKRKAYAATTAAFDDAVGKVADKVRELGLEQDTIFYYTNDNGGPPNDIAANNAPLSGTKFSLWEGGIRVPSFVTWPGHLPAGRDFETPVISLDIFPTLLAAARVDAPTSKQLDGVNLLPALEGGSLFWRLNQTWAIREGHWKLTLPERGESIQLFDLAADPAEEHDLAAQQPAVVERLTQAWTRWNAQNLPAIPVAQ